MQLPNSTQTTMDGLITEGLKDPLLAKEGVRYDKDKSRMDLIPPEWDLALSEVLSAGAKKYPDHNWALGMKWSRILGSLRRHITAFLCGEIYDPETGCHHMAHIAWNALALMSYQLRKTGTDDLHYSGRTYKEVQEGVRLPNASS